MQFAEKKSKKDTASRGHFKPSQNQSKRTQIEFE